MEENEGFDPESHDTRVGARAATKLLSSIENGDLTIFDRREAAALQSMARLWLAFESLGKIAAWFKSGLMLVGFFILTYLTLRNAFVDWFHGAIK